MKKNVFSNQTGFTMLEMMIIIVIIGILASLAVPGFINWIPKMKVKNDAKTNLNYLRLARSKSVADNSQYGIYFDVAGNRVIYFEDTSSPENLSYDPGLDSTVEAPYNMASNVSLINCTFVNNTIIFFPNGSASTSGSITVTDESSGVAYNINVLASTGRVRLEQN